MPAVIEPDARGRLRLAPLRSLEDGVASPLVSTMAAGIVVLEMRLDESHAPGDALTASAQQETRRTARRPRREIRCAICGYGAMVSRLPERCPMGCARAWEITGN